MHRPRHRRFFLAQATLACTAFAALTPSAHAAWRWHAEFARGVPGGVVQVRENTVNGTALPLGSGLGIDYVQRLRLGVTHRFSPGRAVVLRLDLVRMHGEKVFSQPVYFNGVELMPGLPVTTDTNPVNNWQATVLYRQRLFRNWHNRVRLDGELGFTYVGLTYNLQGTPQGASNPTQLSGTRTLEDFITQELPVPLVGLRLHYALTGSWALQASFVGGHLPRLYSLRNEGGKVYVTQTNQEAELGFVHRLRDGLRLGFGWYDRYYMQHEQSNQDGNYIRMNEHGLYLRIADRF